MDTQSDSQLSCCSSRSLAEGPTAKQAVKGLAGRVSQLLSIISGVAVVVHKLYEFNQSEHLQKEWSCSDTSARRKNMPVEDVGKRSKLPVEVTQKGDTAVLALVTFQQHTAHLL